MKASDVDGTRNGSVAQAPSDSELDIAARRTAISLMRLCEGIDHADADTYPVARSRRHRRQILRDHYTEWFQNVARGADLGEVIGSAGDDDAEAG